MKKLLIVESPTKAKTIAKYLGNDFVVKSSVGHIRDLPEGNKAIKITEVGENQWTFEPIYEIPKKTAKSKGKEDVVKDLKAAVKTADEIYLASDPDREGEAIAWHLKEVLSPVAGDKPFKRVTYIEVTKSAVQKAVETPRDINLPLVDAQHARRILDRIVGFSVSPLLWKNVVCPQPKFLSAGRVQSVALRLLAERQRAIDSFVPEKYFVMGVESKKSTEKKSFISKLYRYDDKKPEVNSQQTANNMLLDLQGSNLVVKEIKESPKIRHAKEPFTTSSLQQAASSTLGMSSGRTMKIAQALYEQGLITYMRTDSVNISDSARAAAKDFIISTYGEEFYPNEPNIYKSKKNSQEAHEAIRPTDVRALPTKLNLEEAELKLYTLIWRRFVASQMANAKTAVKTVILDAKKPGIVHSYLFSSSTTAILFEGFLKVMPTQLTKAKKKDSDDDNDDSDEVNELPSLSIGEELDVVRWLADEKETKGPSYYSEASLVKELEENGVGRPSTYASIIGTLIARKYAINENKKFMVTERGKLVWEWLEKKLSSLFEVGYTKEMEEKLDQIAEHGESMNTMLSKFYADFLPQLKSCDSPPADPKQVTLLFSLLSHVTKWEEPQKVGKRTYDHKAIVESMHDQFKSGRDITNKQFLQLVKFVNNYSSQIPDAAKQMCDAGINTGGELIKQQADPELVKYCFSILDRIGGMFKNPFLKSLRDTVERGRSLSARQFEVLARTTGENASTLEDCNEIKEKLKAFVTNGFNTLNSSPEIPELLSLLDAVNSWREPKKKGAKTYDDKSFFESLKAHYARRKTLSERQLIHLRRMVSSYKDQIPNYDQRAKDLGLSNAQKSDEKNA